MKVIKKTGFYQDYDEQKIIDAVAKSSKRAEVELKENDYSTICNRVLDMLEECDLIHEEYNHETKEFDQLVTVADMHNVVEKTLCELYPTVGYQYTQYRNYKLDFVKILDKAFEESRDILYLGDKENSNSDSSFVSTQQSLIRGVLTKAMYKHQFLTKSEIQAINDGYIYIHDMKDRIFSINCCLFDVGNVLNGGFEMGNMWYNEPQTLDVAFDVIGDLITATASQQYGGFTLPRIDTVLSKYAEKSYKKYYDSELRSKMDVINSIPTECLHESEYDELVKDAKADAHEEAMKQVRKDYEQGFQGWEYKLNSVASSRGDYPFTSLSFGLDTSVFGKMATEVCLEVRKNGQGKKGYKKPVLFPKLTFLFDENLHGKDMPLRDLFDYGIDCSMKTMYPDWLSLTGEGYIPSMYKKYGEVVSLMG